MDRGQKKRDSEILLTDDVDSRVNILTNRIENSIALYKIIYKRHIG